MIRAPDYQHPAGRILIFAKAPIAGEVKTRLAAHIGERTAAALYEQLVCDTVRLAVEARLATVELHVSTHVHHRLFVSLADKHQIPVKRQSGHDLGQRMLNALREALCSADFAVLIGTDCPPMSADYLGRACRQLEAGDAVVLGPAADGGYVLIGARGCHEQLFFNIPWGSDRVLELTRNRLQTLNLPHSELETLWDLDRFEDLRRWRRMVSNGRHDLSEPSKRRLGNGCSTGCGHRTRC